MDKNHNHVYRGGRFQAKKIEMPDGLLACLPYYLMGCNCIHSILSVSRYDVSYRHLSLTLSKSF